MSKQALDSIRDALREVAAVEANVDELRLLDVDLSALAESAALAQKARQALVELSILLSEREGGTTS